MPTYLPISHNESKVAKKPNPKNIYYKINPTKTILILCGKFNYFIGPLIGIDKVINKVPKII